MNKNYLSEVLQEYGFNSYELTIEPVNQGLINNTWKVKHKNKNFILQKINSSVFKNPDDIDYNISFIGEFLIKNHPGYLFTAPVSTLSSQTLIWLHGEAFRMFPFIENSHTFSSVATADQAFEAARQFGKFSALLQNLNTSLLKITLPDFHNLTLRFVQFENACNTGNRSRIEENAALIKQLKTKKNIVEKFEEIKKDENFKLRVTHHDTKISNVLFDKNNKGLCVIDLDTVMPGYFISDVGDMMRTYLSAANEEESDYDKIEVRKNVFEAIVEGYSSEMDENLTEKEKGHFLYAGIFMTYMQTIRFLTDHFMNDLYYGASYEGHNLVRAKNQFTLLQKLEQLFD